MLSEPQELIVTSTQDVNLFLAGVGSGKTHLGGFLSGYLVTRFPRVFGFIGANTYNQLTTSTLYRIREVWFELFGWQEKTDYVVGVKPPAHFNTAGHNFDSYGGIISFRWGAIIFKGSLDNAKAHDGKEFGWAILDETKDTREEDVKETILTRLRSVGIYVTPDNQLTDNPIGAARPFNPLYILTSPAKVRWINEWFKLDDHQHEILRNISSRTDYYHREDAGRCVVISSTYHNAHNLPAGYIDRILANNSPGVASKLIDGNPFVKAGGEFYASFNRSEHIRVSPYRPELPIHISFDQNVKPYITATLYQMEHLDGLTYFWQFDEICLSNPNNRTSKLCAEFIRRYGGSVQGLFFYGDPAGRKSDTRANENDYVIVERMLRRFLNNRSNRVPYKHPSVLKRRDFANNLFENKYPVRFTIDPRCKESIADFEFVKEDQNGKKLKEKATDPDTKQSFEKYGHTSDSFDYFVCAAFERLFLQHFK